MKNDTSVKMAKKKKTVTTKKLTKGRVTKKATSGAPKKKPNGNKDVPAKTGSRATSVDSLLKKFEKERYTQEAKLSGARKKIDELESKATKLREQISKLKAEAQSTEVEISQIDSRRDAEVAEILARLGVQLSAKPQSAQRPVLTLGRNPSADEEQDERDVDQDN